jgi:hypothetical protein
MEQAQKEKVQKPVGVWGTVDPVLKIPDRRAVRAGDPVRVLAEGPVKAEEKVAAKAAADNCMNQTTKNKHRRRYHARI